MEIKDSTPIIVFDNQCYLCTKFAKTVSFFARGRINVVGHYSYFGAVLRSNVLDESALEMFWFIDKKKAYGGRAALIPLIMSILFGKTKKSFCMSNDDEEYCQQHCKTVKAVFVRSSSLLRNSRVIDL